MSYEVQGRQYHQWFGHGTGDGVDGGGARELGAADVAAMVVAGAAASLSGATRAGYEAFLSQGGLEALTAAVPVWAAGSGLEAGAFKRLLVGPALGDGAAAALQDVGRLVRGARDAGDLEAASGRLAAAVEAGGSEWRYGLRYAGDKAGSAAARGVVAPGELEDGGTFRVTAAPPGGEVLRTEANWSPEQVVPGIGLPLGRHGGWGLAAGAAVGLGVEGLYLLWRSKSDTQQQEAPFVVEAKPPRDAYDAKGAKAPGKPGAAEGFEDPKKGEEWTATAGGQYGWKDADGNIWVPTGWAGTPGTGTTGPAHGGPHWDVVSPNGDKIKDVYPGGKIR